MPVVPRRALQWTLVGLVAVAGVGLASPVVGATGPDQGDVQELPRHYSQQPRADVLDSVSPGYVLHHVHDLPWYDGHSHDVVLRTGDGSTAWSGYEPSADSQGTALVGSYLTEKVGDSTYWPTSVRFFDIETHELAGEITRPVAETLGAIGPSWILTSRTDSEYPSPTHLEIHRLDGSSTEVPGIEVDRIPGYVDADGGYAWVWGAFRDQLYRVDIAAGTATTVPAPPGGWSTVLVGPVQLFNIDGTSDGHLAITAIDRTTGAQSTTVDVATGILGNGPRALTLGDGLGVWDPFHGIDSTLWKVDLDAGSLGPVVADHLSDVKQSAPGTVAMIDKTQVPGTIRVDDGSGPAAVADLPAVAEGVGALAYDGRLRSTWGDGTSWSIDPGDAGAGWTETPWTSEDRVTTVNDVALVNDSDERGYATSHWHVSWPGGQRDLETNGRVVLGHGGELLVRGSNDGTGYVVERVRTGEVVASADGYGAVADGSWVWQWASPTTLVGRDVDDPDAASRTVPVSAPDRLFLNDVRGRWAMVSRVGTKVIDTLGVVPPFIVPTSGSGAPKQPQLGAGFVVSTLWTYDAYHHYNGSRTVVTDLAPSHASRDLIDASDGRAVSGFDVDEAGSASLAYVEGGIAKVLHLPWLQDVPLTRPDILPPTLKESDGSPALIASSVPVTVHDRWTYGDDGELGSPASGLAAYDVRWRTRGAPGSSFGDWTTFSSAADAVLDLTVPPGQQVCAQARATDGAANVSAWAEERCTRVDGAGPVLGRVTGPARFDVSTLDRAYFGYQATDESGVASYDVQTRSAAPGLGLGAWSTVSANTTGTSTSVPTRPGGEGCMRFRARDDIGNVSAWSAATCTSTAVQDDAFRCPGNSLRLPSTLAAEGFYTRIAYPGAWCKLRRPQVGRTLGAWVIVGPGQGTLDAYSGSVRIGRVRLAAPTWGRTLVTFPMRDGIIKLVQHGRRPVGIDAVAVER